MNITKFIFALTLTSAFQQVLPKAGEYSLCKNIILTIGTCGLYPLIKAFIKTDTEIIQYTYKQIDHVKLNYDNQISILNQNFKLDELTESQKNILSQTINENVLFDLARSIKYENIETYIHDLKYFISNLSNQKSVLQKRIAKLKRINYLEDVYIIKEMQELLYDLELILYDSKFLISYINKHKNFFRLNDLMRKLYEIYKKEIKIMFDKNKNYSLNASLEKVILNKLPEYIYPYLVYADILKNDIIDIRNKSGHNAYLELTQKADELANKLSTIKYFVTGDRKYLIERKELEAKRLQEEIIYLVKKSIDVIEKNKINKEKNELCKYCQKTCYH